MPLSCFHPKMKYAYLILFCLMAGQMQGAEIETHRLEIPLEERSAVFYFVLFVPSMTSLQIIDNGPDRRSPLYRDLQPALQATKCIAGTNGGFFDNRTFAPQGLMIASGQAKGNFQSQSWMKGVLYQRGTSLHLEDVPQKMDFNEVSSFIQSGPWLVRDGQPQTGFTQDEHPRRRTFIGFDKSGRWILGICESATLHGLSRALRSPEMVKVIELDRVLNLDGGPSTGFYSREGSPATYIPTQWTVRNYIGLQRQPSSGAQRP